MTQYDSGGAAKVEGPHVRTEEEKLQYMAQQKRNDEIAIRRKYYEESRERLGKIIIKKIQTAMIGALDNFEIEFGHLWDHGKKFNELSEESKRVRRKWQRARSDILTRGNDQIRAIEKELQEYTVRWDRHQYTFSNEGNK